MDVWIDGWMAGWMDGWMGGWMDGWMDGWVDGWMGGWIDGWMYNVSEEEDAWEDRLLEHRIRWWGAASAAGMQGEGSYKRSVCFTDTGRRRLEWSLPGQGHDAAAAGRRGFQGYGLPILRIGYLAPRMLCLWCV